MAGVAAMQIIDHGDLEVAESSEPLYQMSADETCSAGYENSPWLQYISGVRANSGIG